MLTNNVARRETAIRATLGSGFMVLAAVAAEQSPVVALDAALVTVVALVTAIAGVCPV